jgi:FkbH-like protein
MTILEQHPEMVLRPSDFVAMEINWRDKATNMIEISQQLDLAPSSFVFVDDSPQERELIRQALPQVLVPEFPAQVADLPYLLSRLNDLDHDSYTDTDRHRTELYRTEYLRRDLRKSAGSLDDYLLMLETTMRVSSATEADLGRIEQMFQRTNQFNTTTKRYSLGELAAFVSSSAHALVLGQVRDRFGDHGIVVAALLRCDEQAVIDSFLMSCRVIGRGVESAMLAHLATVAAQHGYDELHGEFVPTRKNEPSRDLYTRHGFVGIDTGSSVQTFVLRELARSPLQSPNHIRLRESFDE